MRKLFGIVMISVLLLSLASGVLAEPKPQNVPHQIMADDPAFAAAFQGTTFGGLWMDMAGAAELPKGDDRMRGPVPIGFNFKFMDGPVELAPGWPPANWMEVWGYIPPAPEGWPSELTDMGYDHVYVGTNGYVVLADPQYLWKYDQDPNVGHGQEWANSAHYYDMALGPGRPNNFIAPFWSDWVIGDNTTWKVEKICQEYMYDVWDEVNEEWDPWYEWVPCYEGGWSEVFRPRGRMLTQTFGDAPNRVFVVEWQNARNYSSGDLISFQLQLFEGSNAILFLYSDPMPAVDGRPFFQPNGVIGMEDSFGKTYVGQFFSAGEQFKPGMNWLNAAAPVADQDMMGFVY